MHIEVFSGTRTPKSKDDTIEAWFWHFKNKGRVTADSEAFPSKANAIRAAKAVVKGVLKESAISYNPRFFGETIDGVTTIYWE